MDTIKQYLDNTICYRLLTSRIFMLLQTVVAAVCFHLNQSLWSLVFFAIVLLIMLLTSKDMSPMLLPILLCSMSVLTNYGGGPNDFASVFPLGGLLIVALILRPFIFRVPFTKGKMFWCMIIVSVSLTLGGLGYLKVSEYFQLVPLYYVFGLGFGLVLTYLLIINYTLHDSVHNPSKVLAWTMVCVGLLGICMIYPNAIKDIMSGGHTYVQWSNNLATFLLLAMPFAFYLASKTEKFGFLFFLLGIMEYSAGIFTLSRGGIIFCTVSVIMCVIATIICSSKVNRIVYSSIIFALLATLVVYLVVNEALVKYLISLLGINHGESRIGLIQVAIENFLAHPLFGTGLAYKGEYYHPQKWCIYWYHSTPFQIIGSLGIVGVFAYAYQYYVRAKICVKRPSKFNVFVTLALLGFELMALVNPGDFAPMPYMVTFTAMLAYMEVINRERVTQEEMIFSKHGGANWREVLFSFAKRRYAEPPQYMETADAKESNEVIQIDKK